MSSITIREKLSKGLFFAFMLSTYLGMDWISFGRCWSIKEGDETGSWVPTLQQPKLAEVTCSQSPGHKKVTQRQLASVRTWKEHSLLYRVNINSHIVLCHYLICLLQQHAIIWVPGEKTVRAYFCGTLVLEPCETWSPQEALQASEHL